MKVLLVDDHPIVRDGLKRLLEEMYASIECEEADCARTALNKIWDNRYDLVILDISMPGRDGLDAVQQIRKVDPRLPILVLSVLPEKIYGPRVLRAGTRGFLSKTEMAEDLAVAVKKILEGERYISPDLARHMVLNCGKKSKTAILDELSDREFQIIRLMAAGKTTNDIAGELFLSEKTIFKARTNIKTKLGLRNNSEIIGFALKKRLVE